MRKTTMLSASLALATLGLAGCSSQEMVSEIQGAGEQSSSVDSSEVAIAAAEPEFTAPGRLSDSENARIRAAYYAGQGEVVKDYGESY